MKTIIIILMFIIGLSSCTQTKYLVKSEQDLSLIKWDYNIDNYIPIMDNYLQNSSILNTSYNLIVLRKYSKLNKYLFINKSETSDFYLATSLYHISKVEYQEAYDCLVKITDEQYELLKDLLLADLSYELARKSNLKNYAKFLKDYQVIIDKYPNNKYLSKIISLRIRHIRYNY